METATRHPGAAAHHSPASTCQARMDSEQQRDPQPHLREGPYLQFLRMGGEGSHFPNGLCPPQDEGQTGQLSCDTGNIHALQGVEADLPRLHGHRQPAIPADDRDIHTSLADEPLRERDSPGMTPGGLGAKRPKAELQSVAGEPCAQGWG